MRSDDEISRDVTEQLRWTPTVDDQDIAIKVCEGVVTLTGELPYSAHLIHIVVHEGCVTL